MNIVYVTDSDVNPGSGGIARTTYVMAEALRTRFGYSVYTVNKLEDFTSLVQQLGKCIVIVQSPCKLAKDVFGSKALFPELTFVTVFHGTPGFELVPIEWKVAKYRIMHGVERKWTVKQLFIQIGMTMLKKSFQRILQKKYSLPYGKSDKIVVLSEGIINQYQSIAPGYRDCFMAIPNAMSFDHPDVPSDKYARKEVLVVARLDDWHKRILEMLKIWALVQKDERFGNWILRIVGDGIDKPFYEEYVKKHQISNISFEGHQNPLQYYQNASVFLMTSACEGLPMTILEAQQCGCIPILYNSFASAKDIVTHGENGFLIPDKDRVGYITTLQNLMSDVEMRKRMSMACLRSCERFSVENIASQWNCLFESMA